MSAFSLALVCLALMLASSRSQTVPDAAAAPGEGLTRFLKDYIRAQKGAQDSTIRYSASLADLNGDGRPEAIVYLSGKRWCGSGGCNLWILTARDQGWQMVTRVSITRPPIRLLPTNHHGWRDIGVWVEGGGILPGHEAVLTFDGRTYPTNPTIAPAHSAKHQETGEILISRKSKGISLFP